MSTLALIAHNKKADLLAWATYNRATLARFTLIATRQTAELIRDKVGLPAEQLLSGPEGGDAQIAARVATREVAAVFFCIRQERGQEPPANDGGAVPAENGRLCRLRPASALRAGAPAAAARRPRRA